MSGASEATLQELLEVNKSMADAIRGLASKSGGGAGGGGAPNTGPAQKGLDGLSKTASIAGMTIYTLQTIIGASLTPAIKLASAGFSAVSAGLGLLTQTGKAVLDGQKQLAQGAIEGTNGLSSFADSLKSLPGPLGLIAEAYAYQQKKLEANLHTYQKISDAGATFGGSLTEVRNSAMGMGLSMSEFAEVMKKNGPALIKFGHSAEDGARKLAKFNTDLIQGELGKGILGLGYSLTEANNLLGGYATIVGGLNESQMKDQKRMEQSVASFANEMDLSAQLEGKSRQEKEEEMKKASANAALQAKLATMTQDQKDKYQLALSNALRTGGQGAADALNSTLLGLPPMTKAAQMFTAVMPNANKAVQENAKLVQDSSTIAQSENKIRENGAKGAVGAANDIKKLGKAADALSYAQGGNADLQSTINAGKKLEAQQTNQGIKTEKDAIDQQKKLIEEQEKRKKSEVGAAAQAEARAKYQAGIMDQVYAALAKLFPVVEFVVKAFTKVFQFAGNVYKNIIEPAFKELFGGIKLSDIVKPFKDFWEGLFGGSTMNMTDIKDKIVNFIKPIRDFVGDIVKSIDFKALGERFRETFTKVFNAVTDLWKTFKDAMGGNEGMAAAFKKYWEMLSSVISDIVDGIVYVVKLFVASPLFATLKKIFATLVDIIKNIVDVIVTIVKSPIGTFLMNALFDVFAFLGDIIDGILQAVNGVIQIVSGVFKILTGDFKGGWEKIKNGVIAILKGMVDWFLSIPKLIGNLLVDGLVLVGKALEGIITSVIDGIKAIAGGILSFFKSSGEKEAEKQKVENKTAPAPTAAQTPDPAKWAHDVYVGDKRNGDVPAEIKGKVQALLDKPPQAWIDEVNKKQQANNQAKTETKAETKPVEAQKPAATPAVDLNNKDAVAVLKAIADYQRRTVDAVNNLNGNLYKRA